MSKKIDTPLLLASSSCFSQTKDGAKRSTKEMLQGIWLL